MKALTQDDVATALGQVGVALLEAGEREHILDHNS